FLSHEIWEGEELKFDVAAFAFADSLATDGLTSFIEGITFFASKNFITPVAILLIVYFLFIHKHRWYTLKVPVVALGSITLNLILKNIFDRPRPVIPHLVEASGLSFPSGHSMVAASFYGLLIYLVWVNVKNKLLKWAISLLLLLFIILIGFSRIYLHVHYATDVVAGLAAGFMWVIVGIASLRRLEKYSKRQIDPMVQEGMDSGQSHK
ncbi:MAG: phosphatase PAP2 family protein, partial [Hymenobacteraceae bacterium]|nr:phosphatase PAP2 family protein [Hymenobacteraceae bacterium]